MNCSISEDKRISIYIARSLKSIICGDSLGMHVLKFAGCSVIFPYSPRSLDSHMIIMRPTKKGFMNYVKFYGLLGYQHGIQLSLNQTKLKQLKKKKYIRVQENIYEAASVFEKDGICYANMNYISNPEFKGIDTSQVLKIKID
jgi:hypothetical protein